VMGPEGAINIVFRNQLKDAKDEKKTRQKLVDDYRRLFANPFRSAELGNLDAIILPEDTRPTLIRTLEMLKNKRETNLPRKHGNVPL